MQVDKLPPNSPDIERDVISVLSHRPDMIITVEELITPECFYNPDYRYLFEVMMELCLAGQSVTQSTILQKIIPSGRRDILEIYQKARQYFSSEGGLYGNCEILFELRQKREAISYAHKLLNLAHGNGRLEEIENVVSDFEEVLSNGAKNIEGFSFAESLEEVGVLMDKPLELGLSGISTGSKLLNRFTGGWQNDDTVIIAARPGMGKTIVACFEAYEAAKSGIPVAFVSLEMSKAKLTARMISAITGFPSSDITKGRLSAMQKDICRKAMKEIEGLPIYYYSRNNSWDIADISRTMRNWKRKFGIGMIIIDYIQLVTDRAVKDSGDDTRILNSVMPKITRLKSSIDTPIIALSQISRGSEDSADKRPRLKDLRFSGKIEEQATIVVFLFRQDYYDANAARDRMEEFHPNNEIEFIFAKNREGELGPAILKCVPALNQIYDIGTIPETVAANAPDIFRNANVSF